MTIVHHTPEDMDDWRRSWADDPAIAKLYELIVRRATEQGGLTAVAPEWKQSPEDRASSYAKG